MHFSYCPHCGTKAVPKEIGDEGIIPYCPSCQQPLWDLFPTSVICAVVSDEKQVALLRQDYVSTSTRVCVAGIMKEGESAEDAAAREVQEELGLTVSHVSYIRSWPYTQKGMLMLGFRVDVKQDTLRLSQEVDEAQWFPFDTALDQIKTGSVAWQLVKAVIDEGKK
jgi:NAD+ diphosphatase